MKPLMDEDSSLPDRGMLGGRGLIYKDLKGTERDRGICKKEIRTKKVLCFFLVI